jgi:hypothetical protein
VVFYVNSHGPYLRPVKERRKEEGKEERGRGKEEQIEGEKGILLLINMRHLKLDYPNL